MIEKARFSVLVKVILPAVIAPVLAGLLALAATFLAYRATARADADTTKRRFKIGQVVSASTVAVGWAVTLPAAAAVGAAASWLAAHGTAGVIVVAVSSLALGAGIYAASRRSTVTALNVNDVPLPPPVRLAA